MVWSCKIIPHWPRRWPILISYVLSCSSSPLDEPLEYPLRSTFDIPFFICIAIYLIFFWCCNIVWCTCVFHTFASFSVSLELVWQPGSLINMDGTNQLTSRTMAGSGSLNSSRLKLLNSAIKWWWLSTTHVCSQNNYKIENGSKKTFTIIPKSVKFVNVFFHE